MQDPVQSTDMPSQAQAPAETPDQPKQSSTVPESADVEMQSQTPSASSAPEQKAPTENVLSTETIITSDYEQVQQMYQAQNMTRGMAPQQMMTAEQVAEAKSAQEAKPRTIFIPDAIYAEFQDVNIDNEEFFEYISYYVLMQFLEKITDLKWVLQFPNNIPSSGRSYIHDIATTFGLTSHSKGAKKRSAMVYPTIHFKDKQQSEANNKVKEYTKLKEKAKALIAPDNPKTIRDKMIALIAEEARQIPNQATCDRLRGEIFHTLDHVPVEFEPYMEFIKPIIAKKRAELSKSQYAESTPEPELGELKTDEDLEEEKNEEELKGDPTAPAKKKKSKKKKKTEAAEGAVNGEQDKEEVKQEKPSVEDVQMKAQNAKEQSNKPIGDSDTDDDDQPDKESDAEMANREPTKEEIEAALKYRMTKQAEAAKIRDYKQKVEQTNAAEFKDRPDPIQNVWVLQSFDDSVILQWEKPCENNEEIVLYNIFVSEQKNVTNSDMLYQTEAKKEEQLASYKISDLEPNKIYYVRIFAVNAIGEGYPADDSAFIRTMDDALNEPGSLYVWGNNQSSELGLTDEQVAQNEQSFVKGAMMEPVRHSMFENKIYDVAPGNVTSLFQCVNTETKDTFIVMCGMTVMTADGADIDQNELTESDVNRMQDVPSIPFQVDFNIPVAKVVCGDMFAGLLTCEGSVFTWGYNNYGQLGVKLETTLIVQRPNQINFLDRNSDSGVKHMKVKDLCVGYNHGMALTDTNHVFVWGRRQGIYPQMDLSFNYLTKNAHLMQIEINQAQPRMLANNLIFYKIKKMCAGPWNSALLTDTNQVLIQGDNEFGQLGLGPQIGGMCRFFPNFLKLDFFEENKLEVIDVTFTGGSSHFLCRGKESDVKRVFSIGNNDFGQLGNNSALSTHAPVEITDQFPDEVIQISSGGYHTLALTASNQVYGFGKLNKGQFATKWQRGQPKFAKTPQKIELPKDIELSKIYAGSLYTMLEVVKNPTQTEVENQE